jgi:beta-lactamase class A
MAKGRLLLLASIILILFFINQIFDLNIRLATPNFNPNPLERVVSYSLKDYTGTYAVVIKNFKTGEEFKMNEGRNFEPASLYKLWLMATVYTHIKDGKLTEDQRLSQSIPALNSKFGITDPELTTGGITQEVSLALHQMITISHNYSALLLAEEVGNSQMEVFLENYGLKNSGIGDPPKTTAADIALYFEKLYKKELVSPEYSDKMLELLKKQQLNGKLPKYLPQGTPFAHKTGELGWFSHDAGIVYSPRADYLIVILSESSLPVGANERIANLSKTVFDYFQDQD